MAKKIKFLIGLLILIHIPWSCNETCDHSCGCDPVGPAKSYSFHIKQLGSEFATEIPDGGVFGKSDNSEISFSSDSSRFMITLKVLDYERFEISKRRTNGFINQSMACSVIELLTFDNTLVDFEIIPDSKIYFDSMCFEGESISNFFDVVSIQNHFGIIYFTDSTKQYPKIPDYYYEPYFTIQESYEFFPAFLLNQKPDSLYEGSFTLSFTLSDGLEETIQTRRISLDWP